MATPAEILADLHAVAEAVDLTRHRLGDDCFDLIAAGIHERSIHEQQSPALVAWAPNAPAYARSRRKAGKPVGVLTGEMLSLEQLKGTRAITPKSGVMRYATSSTAADKGAWFTEGADRRPARPFYDTDPQIEDAVAERIGRAVDDAIEAAFG